MPRPKEFDTDNALLAAQKVFWERGYHATTMRDISAATGIAHAGLYAAFKGKDALFYRALRKYASEQTSHLFGALEQPDAGKAEIESFFDRVIAGARSGSFSNGCFVAASSTEYLDDDLVTELLADTYSRQVRAFRHALNNARLGGDIASSTDGNMIASMMVTLFYGMSALARRGAAVAEIQRSAQAALRLIS